MNTMHLMSQKGNMTLEQFDAAMGPTIGIAANLKVGLADVSAAEATLTQHGMDAAEAATQLKSIMEHIVNPVGVAGKTLKELSKQSGESAEQLKSDWQANHDTLAKMSNITGVDLVKAFSMAGLSANGLAGTMKIVSAAVNGHYDQVMKLIPALRGGFGAMILAGTGAKDLSTNLGLANEAMAGKIDPTTRDFNRTMATMGQQFQVLKQQIEADLIPAGEKLMPVIHDLIPAIKDTADMVVGLVTALSNMPRPVQDIVLGFGALSAINMGLGGGLFKTAGFVATLIGKFGGLASAAGTETGGAAAALTGTGEAGIGMAGVLTGTVLPAVVATGAALGALYLLWEKWENRDKQSDSDRQSAYQQLEQFGTPSEKVSNIRGDMDRLTESNYNPAAMKDAAEHMKRIKAAGVQGFQSPMVGPQGAGMAYNDALAQARSDYDQASAGQKSFLEKMAADKKAINDLIVSSAGDGNKNEQAYLRKMNAAHNAAEKKLLGGSTGKSGGSIVGNALTAEDEKKPKKPPKGDPDKSGGINEASQQIRTALGVLAVPVPEILGKMVNASHAVEIATKLMTGEIHGADMSQKAYIVSLATAWDRLEAGRAATDGYKTKLADLNKELALGKDATAAQTALYEYNIEGQLKDIAVTGKKGDARRALLQTEENAIKAARSAMTTQRDQIVQDLKDVDVKNILTAATNKLHLATIGQAQASLVAAAGSQQELDQMSAANRAILQGIVDKTTAADKLKESYLSSISVLDDYIKKGRDAANDVKGPQSFSQKAAVAVADLKAQPSYDPSDILLQGKIAAMTSAGKALDDQSALADITKWGTTWQSQIGEMMSKMSGAYVAGQAAFDRWKLDNIQGLASVKAALGDQYQAWEDNARAIFGQIDTLARYTAGVENYRKAVADANHESEIMKASTPYGKFLEQQKTYNPDTYTYEVPSGVSNDQNKALFKQQQLTADIREVGDNMQHIFTSAFETAYKKGSAGFLLSLREGLQKTLYDSAIKAVSGQISGGVTSMLTKMSGAKGHVLPIIPGVGKGDPAEAALVTSNKALQTIMKSLTDSVTALNKTVSGGANAAAGAGSGSGAGGGNPFSLLNSVMSGASPAYSTITSMFGLPAFADGGAFDGSGPILVGENGPEILHPSSGGRILSHDDAMSAMASRRGGGDTHYNYNTSINVNAPTPSAYKASAHQIAAEQSRALARHRR
jgi:hypothetical protein